MQNFRVIYSGNAVEDIRNIYDYIAYKLFNPQIASQQSDRIMSAAESLAVFPKMHRVRKKDSKGNETRFFPIDNYLILYDVDDDKHTVNILRVVYRRRNIDDIIL